MKKMFIPFFLFAFLCACAGNPPQWWNPSGTYGAGRTADPAAQPAARPSLSSSVTAEQEEPYPLEQTIEPAVESYEELNLSPLGAAQDAGEIVPEAAAPAAAEPLPQTQDFSAPQPAPKAQPDIPAFAEEEHLPEDGSLPPPSVLQ